MCGNGIRCVAKFAVDSGISRRNPIRVETGRGTLAIEWKAGIDGKVNLATVDMGGVITGRAWTWARPRSCPEHRSRAIR